MQSIVGQMRCLEQLGEWEDLYNLANSNWPKIDVEMKGKIARGCAASAWSLGKWDDFKVYTDHIRRNTADYPFYKAILAVHRDEFSTAQNLIDSARDKIDSHLTTMVGESQDRAYGAMVSVMLFSELEEAIQYKMVPEKRDFIKNKWWNRLAGCQKLVDDWQRILRVHSLVLTPYEDRKSWLKFASICQKTKRIKLSQRVLQMLIAEDNYLNLDSFNSMPDGEETTVPNTVFLESFWKKPNSKVKIVCPQIAYGFIKSQWRADEKKQAFDEMKQFNEKLLKCCQDLNTPEIKFNENNKLTEDELLKLTAKTCYKLGNWQSEMYDTFNESLECEMLNYFKQATIISPDWYKAWNAYALSNYKTIFFSGKNQINKNSESELSGSDYQGSRSIKFIENAVAAIEGFFKSISLSHGSSLQDTLRLLTILFDQGKISKAFFNLKFFIHFFSSQFRTRKGSCKCV